MSNVHTFLWNALNVVMLTLSPIHNSEILTVVNKIWQRDKHLGGAKSLEGLWEFVDR